MKKFTEKDFLKLQQAEADRKFGKGARIYHAEWRELNLSLLAIITRLHREGHIDASQFLEL